MNIWGAVFSAVAAVAASVAAIVSFAILREMRQTNKRQLRAYIGLHGMGLELPGLRNPKYQPTDPNKVGLIINDSVLCRVKNYGGTPALDVKTVVNWVHIQFGQRLADDFSYQDFEAITAPGIGRVISHLHLMQEQIHATRVPIYDVGVFR